uniref:Uncharacterized protein n=1 Tax=Anguilla anguilla TaxID=7936 RepID=A0A0E9WAX8_ANGAN
MRFGNAISDQGLNLFMHCIIPIIFN